MQTVNYYDTKLSCHLAWFYNGFVRQEGILLTLQRWNGQGILWPPQPQCSLGCQPGIPQVFQFQSSFLSCHCQEQQLGFLCLFLVSSSCFHSTPSFSGHDCLLRKNPMWKPKANGTERMMVDRLEHRLSCSLFMQKSLSHRIQKTSWQ